MNKKIVIIAVAVVLGHDIFTMLRHERGYARNFILPLGPSIIYRDLDPHGEWYWQTIDGASWFSFRALNEDYGKDNHTVFHQYGAIPGADVVTFKSFDRHFAKDTNYIYHWKEKITDFDVATFEVLGSYVKDKNGIYFPEFAWDKSEFRVVSNKIINADSATFEALPSGYAKDKTGVYLAMAHVKKLDGVDAVSFEGLQYGYGKDAYAVYYYGEKIFGADTASFRTLDKGSARFYAQDKNGVYLFGKLISTNPENFAFPPLDPT